MTRGSAADQSRAWTRLWIAITAGSSVLLTVADAVLLQLRRGYFTGGFLAADHLTGALRPPLFLLLSLLADAAIVGVIAAVVLWVAARLGLSRRAAAMLGVTAAALPLLAADAVEYRIAGFLGDTFDLSLMFDLAGRNPAELLAVAAGHLAVVGSVIAGASVAAVGAVWMLARRRRGRYEGPPPAAAKIIALPALSLVLALAGTTAARTHSDELDNGLRRTPAAQLLGAIVDTVSDVDRDGAGLLGRPADPALFDARIRPYALEVAGNGIDEDGVGGDLPAGLPAYREPDGHPAPWRSRRDVVLVVLESFRADARGAVLKGRPVTPVLDALAARGISATRAYSHNGYTVQSRRHIFTGSVADVRGDTTLIDDFNANGYETAYFSGQDESFGGPPGAVGFDRADVHYDARDDRDKRYSTFSTAGSLAVPWTLLLDRVTGFLDRRAPARPLFLYVNFEDTHFPYHHQDIAPLVNDVAVREADITPDHRDAVRATYLNTAANVDRAIGLLLDRVRRTLGREPAVVVLADHGESLFDEGFLGHGYSLNDAQARIPLVVANLPAVIPEPFGQADLRDMLRAALDAPETAPATPVVRPDASHPLFQYLGTMARPGQIALTIGNRKTAYDFRDRRVAFDGGPWVDPEYLTGADLGAFHELVWTWERMRLARTATDGS